MASRRSTSSWHCEWGGANKKTLQFVINRSCAPSTNLQVVRMKILFTSGPRNFRKLESRRLSHQKGPENNASWRGNLEEDRLRCLFFNFSIYTPQQLPNTRARRGIINKRGEDTCTERSIRQGGRLGRFRVRLHLAPGRVEREISSEGEGCH